MPKEGVGIPIGGAHAAHVREGMSTQKYIQQVFIHLRISEGSSRGVRGEQKDTSELQKDAKAENYPRSF
jgi:hypothetical protein